MRRYFTIGNFNTWYDWRCTLTGKDIQAPEPKTNYVMLDGVSGSLDFTEALTGEVTYNDRTITASFMCSEGSHPEREQLLRRITNSLHGRRVQIIEPDDPDHYFEGRVKITNAVNRAAYLEFTVEAVCDPWRYALEDTTRTVVLSPIFTPDGYILEKTDLFLTNGGVRTLCPSITVDGVVQVGYNGNFVELKTGSYRIAEIKLPPGDTVLTLGGNSYPWETSVAFTYREVGL